MGKKLKKNSEFFFGKKKFKKEKNDFFYFLLKSHLRFFKRLPLGPENFFIHFRECLVSGITKQLFLYMVLKSP